jgi:carboxylesterase type B
VNTKNIATYNGDPDQIYVTGHSAGEHLGALAIMNKEYHIPTNTLKGIILNVVVGLDIYSYLLKNKTTKKTITTIYGRWIQKIGKPLLPITLLMKKRPK